MEHAIRTCISSGFTLSVAMFTGVTLAADLPKEGKISHTYSAVGTIQATPVGKERLLLLVDQRGLSVGTGLTDHMTWHCWGTEDVLKGVVDHNGWCVGTDPAGDQFFGSVIGDPKQPVGVKVWRFSGAITYGTGKLDGIDGSWTGECHGSDFKPISDNTYVNYCSVQSNYKIP